MLRALVLVGVLALLLPASARAAQRFEVFVDPSLTIADLRELSDRGAAVGLLVPANGPTTSRREALAAVERGAVENSFLGGLPTGPRLIRVRKALPAAGWTSYAPPVRAILVGLPRDGPQSNDRRYPIAVVGAGYEGLLTSDSTRIPGLVSIADVAPTALGTEDALGSQADDDPVAAVERLDDRITGHVDARLWAALVAGLGVLLWGWRLRARGALWGFVVGLGANLIAGAAGIGGWPAVALVGGATVVVTPFVARAARSDGWLGCALVAVLGGYLVAMAADARVVALSPWGPAQAGRFYGVTNLLETMLAGAALGAGAIAWRRLGPIGLAAVGILALVTVGGSRFGADGGGAIVLGVGFAVLGVLLARRGPIALAGALAASAAVVVAFTWIDSATGASSHVTEAVGGGAGNVATDLGHRLRISWEHATAHWYTALVVLASIAALVVLALWLARRDGMNSCPVAFALLAAVAASLLVNDAPTDVAAVGLFVFASLAVGRLAPDASARPARPAPRARGVPLGGRLRRRGDRRAHA